MGAKLRGIRGRINSTKSMAKITRAQELIASSRIVKAQQRVKESGPYARQITRAISALVSHNVGVGHPLLTERTDSKRVAVLLITSDRGFCGGYNVNVIREAEGLMAMLRDQGKEPVPYIVGRKGVGWYRFREREYADDWTGFSDRPRFENAETIGRTLVQEFGRPAEDGGVAEIHIVFTEFVSMLTQTAQVRRLLPLEIEEADEAPEEQTGGVLPAYDFEPSADAVLDALLPSYIESRIWHMLLQSAASEHAQRRRAMKSATDNANDVIETLTRVANQARQAEITQEISEIVGGANALAETSAGSE
ncbi:MAG: synthase gamma subunit [Actinoallomurus sp.]|nr:synthase gamma subunit [Actinoallomurus sp.]